MKIPSPAHARTSAREQFVATWTVFRLVNLRQLTRRRRRAALTLAGIAAAVSLVVAITVVNAAVRGTVRDTAVGLAGVAQLEARPFGAPSLAPAAIRRTNSAPGVGTAVPSTQQITRMQHGGAATRVLVAGMPPSIAALFPNGFGDATAAVVDPAAGSVVLSPHLAETLGAGAGDAVTVATPTGTRRLFVGAVLPNGVLSSVNGGDLALTGLAYSQRLFDRPGKVDRLYITPARGQSVEALQRQLRRTLYGKAIVGDPGASAAPFEHTFDGIATTTQQIRAVALLVALFLVLNTMAMSLAERRADLALLVTGGTQRGPIVAAFVAEAALVGLAGGALGTVIGFLLAHRLVEQAGAVYESVLPITSAGAVHLTARQALLGVLSGAAVAMAGAAFVARRVVRLTPIEALAPAAPYAVSAQSRGPRSGLLALGGLVATACAALVVAFAPVGSHPELLGLALMLTLAGSLLLLPFLVGALSAGSRRAWPQLLGVRGRLAADGLVRAPGRTTVAAGALGLTIALVVASASGLGSFRQEVNRAATTWFAAPLYVRANGEGLLASDQPLPVSLRRRLAAIEGVRAAYPIRAALLERRNQQVAILAFPIAQAARHGDQLTGDVPVRDQHLVAAVGRGQVVASRLTARRHRLHTGSILHVSVAGTDHRFRVAGTFNDLASTDAVYLEHSIYTRLSEDEDADRFALMLDSGANRAVVAARVQRFLDANGLPGTVATRGKMESYVLDLVNGLFSLAGGAQLAALLIAAMVVLNTMLTVTFERRRELGLQRMLGMTGRQQAGTVVLEAVAMSAVGAALAVLLGLVLGALMTIGIENQLAWHVSFHPAIGETVAAVLVAIAIGAAAACYPSWLATRAPLMELLRVE
ncbi:MAG TPA: FtsX-like permease family protein [Conexibacter sp.]|jgi:putative ABC transport system permease protein|nr:FtsX-like permease family protein [Conexibacter sp.]